MARKLNHEKVKKEGKGIIKEFKKFILRGNMLDLAVGMIVGASFNSIVSSLVNDIFMPVIGWLVGDTDFSNLYLILSNPENLEKPATLAEAKALGLATFNYGSFLTAVLHFIIMAVVVFLIVKVMNKIADLGQSLTKKNEKKPDPTTKKCPYCQSVIDIKAVRCPHCTSILEEEKTE